jgi:hypothetical protein
VTSNGKLIPYKGTSYGTINPGTVTIKAEKLQ